MANTKRQRQKQSREASRAYFQAQERRARRRRQVLAGVALFLVLGLVVGGFLTNTPDRGADQTAEEGKAAAPDEGMPAEQKPDPTCPPADGGAERKITFAAPPPNCIDTAKSYRATVETDVGTFVADLDDEKAPKTVNNFVFLARHNFYDGVPFHRVIPGFVVQGGDGEKGDGTGGPGYTIPDELPRGGYPEGALAMANTGRPNSGGSQFFVVTGEQGASLPPRYTLFGQVTQGLDVVKKIEADGSSDGAPSVVHRVVNVTITES